MLEYFKLAAVFLPDARAVVFHNVKIEQRIFQHANKYLPQKVKVAVALVAQPVP